MLASTTDHPRFLFVEMADYASPGIGGGARSAANIFRAMQDDAAYVFAAADPEWPLGVWVHRVVGAIPHWCYCVRHIGATKGRPVIPGRISDYLAVRRHRSGILRLGVRSAMIEAPEVLLAVQGWGWKSLCYRFPGIENPLERSRYPFGRFAARAFDQAFFRALKGVDVILAAADESAIASVGGRSRGAIRADRIRQFPTSADSTVFFPMAQSDARRELGWHGRGKVLLFCGRLNAVKGWRLVLEAFKCLSGRGFVGELWIVGDGEDRQALQQGIEALGIASSVRCWGAIDCTDLPKYYNAADLFLSGSHYEGWSQSMLEALFCGVPIVSTAVSAVRYLVQDGKNGYVVPDRDPMRFAEAIEAALALPDAAKQCLKLAGDYDVKHLRSRLNKEWNPVG